MQIDREELIRYLSQQGDRDEEELRLWTTDELIDYVQRPEQYQYC